MSIKLADAASTKLRFRVGARVECCVGEAWAPGTVLQYFYTQETFEAGTCVPYQVALDDGRLVFARRDADSDVRLLNEDVSVATLLLPQRGLNRMVTLQAVRSCVVYMLAAFLLMQLAEHYCTGRASWSLPALPRFTVDDAGVAGCAASFAAALIPIRDASTIEWLSRSGIRAKTGGADVAALVVQSTFFALGHEVFFRGALPAVALLLFPDNDNALMSGLTFSIVPYYFIHRQEHAAFAGFAGFWFAIAAFYGNVSTAVIASFAAQLGAAYLHFRAADSCDDAFLPPKAPEKEATAPNKEAKARSSKSSKKQR